MPEPKPTVKPRIRYQAFLLRFWPETGEDSQNQPTWRFSLEDPYTRVRQGFASLAELIIFLEERIASTEDNFNRQNKK